MSRRIRDSFTGTDAFGLQALTRPDETGPQAPSGIDETWAPRPAGIGETGLLAPQVRLWKKQENHTSNSKILITLSNITLSEYSLQNLSMRNIVSIRHNIILDNFCLL